MQLNCTKWKHIEPLMNWCENRLYSKKSNEKNRYWKQCCCSALSRNFKVSIKYFDYFVCCGTCNYTSRRFQRLWELVSWVDFNIGGTGALLSEFVCDRCVALSCNAFLVPAPPISKSTNLTSFHKRYEDLYISNDQ